MKKIQTDNLLLPLYLMEEGDKVGDIPSGSYVLGRHGISLVSGDDTLQSVRRIDCGTLPDVSNTTVYTGDKLDAASMATAELVFQQAFNMHRSEAEVLIYRRKKDKAWLLRLPSQDVSGASVRYVLTPEDPWFCGGSLLPSAPPDNTVEAFGTIHSHASMSAFFSSTDDADQRDMPGIHIVFGLFHDAPLPESKKDGPRPRVSIQPIAPIRVKARVCCGGVFSATPIESVADMAEITVDLPEIPEGQIQGYGSRWAMPSIGAPLSIYGTGDWDNSPYAQRQKSAWPGPLPGMPPARAAWGSKGYSYRGDDETRQPTQNDPERSLEDWMVICSALLKEASVCMDKIHKHMTSTPEDVWTPYNDLSSEDEKESIVRTHSCLEEVRLTFDDQALDYCTYHQYAVEDIRSKIREALEEYSEEPSIEYAEGFDPRTYMESDWDDVYQDDGTDGDGIENRMIPFNNKRGGQNVPK